MPVVKLLFDGKDNFCFQSKQIKTLKYNDRKVPKITDKTGKLACQKAELFPKSANAKLDER